MHLSVAGAMGSLIDNLRRAVRELRHRPVFAATVVLTLAIGIGATAAAFALVDAVFLTRLPVQDQDRLVAMGTNDRAQGFPEGNFAVPWLDTRRFLLERHDVFTDITGYGAGADPYAARDGDRTLHLTRALVTGTFFDLLGVKPTVGRLLRPDDDIVGGPGVVVLSDRLWRREFGADPQVVGRTLLFAGATYRVVGVAPPEFSFPARTESWVPVAPELGRQYDVKLDRVYVNLIGRLKPGVTLRAARAELEYALRADSATGKYGPDTNPFGFVLQTVAVVERYTDLVLGREVRPGVIVLFAAVALVLVIGCTNVAGLLLARGISRAPEVAVRAALGAGRRQLVTYVLTESLLLGTAGGLLGVALAAALVRAAVALAPPELPMIDIAHLDPRVLAFTALITIGAAIGSGLAPAFQETGLDAHRVLRGGRRSATGGPLAGLARRSLVAVQLALALVVLCGAGVLTRTMAQLRHVPLGFDPTHLLFFKVDAVVPGSTYHGIKSSPARFTALRDRIAQDFPHVPGLGKVSTAFSLPFNGAAMFPYTIDGQLPTKEAPGRPMRYEVALDDYFGVMSIPLRRGRTLTALDDRQAPVVVVVNESMAQDAWPGQDPIGHRVRVFSDSVDRFWTVVGVVADDRFTDLAARPRPTTYFPARQEEWDDPWFVVRTQGEPGRAVKLVGQTVGAMDSMFAVRLSTTGPELLRARLARPRALTAVFNALATTALLLAALGLFGVLSSYVRERRREMAVRSALGATPTHLRSLVLTQTLGVAVVGLTCGMPLAISASRLLETMVNDVHPLDALTVVAVAAVLLAVVACATYGPMVRASRVDARSALAAD